VGNKQGDALDHASTRRGGGGGGGGFFLGGRGAVFGLWAWVPFCFGACKLRKPKKKLQFIYYTEYYVANTPDQAAIS
jgi:hypothetical protein